MAEQLFIDAFVEVAREHGARPAVVDTTATPERALTYAELLARARRLASLLRAHGVEPGDLVALELPRSIDSVVAMLACWLARAAFVPIDPSLPVARREALLDDAGARCRVGPGEVTADESGPLIEIERGAPDDLAYVIYTSGSTGEPKGVRVAHRGLLPMLAHQREQFRLTAGKRALLVLSTSFDASISDIGTTLLAGATLFVEDATCVATPERLLEALTRRRITHVDLPPSILSQLVPEALPSSLETIVIGGEVCPVDVVRAFAARVRLVNVYGPTEATICTSLVVCDARAWARPSIGAPIPGIEYAIVDETLAPVADGRPGELLIRGRGLALGYLRRPALEAAKFVQTALGRAYRTGDRVVRHGGGEIEFLGRVDRQLKVRGQLVEPEEIEACLARHAAVRAVAVVARALDDKTTGLVAFVVAEHVTAAELRAHVLAALPRWMCPARFERVEALPRSLTGKVQLQALVERLLSPQAAGESARGPRESIVAELFVRVLGLETVAREDDFFALGGTSLSALQLAALAEARGIPLSPEAIYAHPTVAGLAATATRPSTLATSVLDEDARRASIATTPSTTAAGRDLLITGATGFLGARVLHELLTLDDDRALVCLVRAASETEGLERIRVALDRQGLVLDGRRVRVVLGDVRRARCGLDPHSFESLAARTASVHHLGADVNLVLPYVRLRDTNVLGAAHARSLGRPVHHASTLSVLACVTPRPARAREERLLDDMLVHGGYAQSKWAAERVLHDARTTVRFGLLTGDSSTGRGAPTCQLMTFVRGLARLGVFPEEGLDGLAVDVTPIDCAARAWVALTTGERDPIHGAIFHVANGRSLRLDDLLRALRDYGVALRPTTRAGFRAQVAEAEIDRTVATTFLAACRRLLDEDDDERHAASDLFLASGLSFDTSRTERALAGESWAPPIPDRALLFRYFAAALERPEDRERR